MKRIIGLLCLIFILILCSCEDHAKNQKIQDVKQTLTPNASISNEAISIYDINNTKIGTIERYGALVLTDDSIIYNKIPTGSVDSISEMDYYRYMFKTKENIKLGTVKNWSYEAKYDTTVIDNSLYMFVTTGEISDITSRTLRLYKIDLKSNTMSVVFSETGGFPYNSMTAVGKKLLMVRVIATGGSELDEYNTETKERKTLKKFDFDDKANIGEAIRQITSDENTISLLRLKMDLGGKSNLFLDVYDHDMKFQNSVDVSTISPNSTDATQSELRQGVSSFVVVNDYIYYANFSTTRFLGKINNHSLRSIIDINPEFEMSSESAKSELSGLFYQSFGKKNDLYLLNYSDGIMKKTTFYADDKRYYMINISRYNDKLLITMRYKDPNTGVELEPKLYYIKISNLKFL